MHNELRGCSLHQSVLSRIYRMQYPAEKQMIIRIGHHIQRNKKPSNVLQSSMTFTPLGQCHLVK
jgi:hypothetical protein